MNWNFMNILMFFGLVQGFLLSILVLIKKKNKKYAAYLLAAMLFALSMNLLYYFLRDVGIMQQFSVLENFYLPWPMLGAVCFYLYIVFSAPFQKRLTALNIWAFAPFIVFSLIHITIRLCTNFATNSCLLSEGTIDFIYVFEEYFAIIYSFILGFLCYAKLNDHERKVQLHFSNYNASKLIFHRRLLLIMLLFCVLWLAVYSYVITSNLSSTEIYYSLWVFSALVLQWIAWTGFIRDEALLPVFFHEETVQEESNQIGLANERGTKKFDETNSYYKELLVLFNTKKVYIDPNLSLNSLAEKLGIGKSYLSALLNQVTQKNFYEFVNTYRVNHLIDLFENKQTENFTILSLAFDSGFNSKSTFQAAFKKITTKTPSAYIKEMKNQEVAGKPLYKRQ